MPPVKDATRNRIRRCHRWLGGALNFIVFLVLAFGTGMYTQEHLNRVWDRAASSGSTPALAPPPMPTPPLG